MTRLPAALWACALVLSLAACGAPGAAAPAPETPPAPEEPAPAPEPPAPTAEELAAQQVEDLLASLTREEKVGQLFFVRCPGEGALADVTDCHLGGYLLFTRDFQDANGGWLTEDQFTETIQSYQTAAAADSGIPLLIGSDEEGGSVTRASHNPNLFPSGPFRSPQWLARNQHDQGNIFAEDAWEKSARLLALGINVNLAPVCDVSTNPADFIYDRTLGRDAAATAEYVTGVVTAMTEGGMGSVLKHFPGYGDNADTHTGIALDKRSYETFVTSDFLPFQAGFDAGGGAAAVLVSHNIVNCMDPDLPASLSPAVHEILRNELGFEGVVMTDDLAMEAVAAYSQDGAVAVLALLAGNDLVLTTDYRTQIPKVLEALESGALTEDAIDAACRRVLRWKQALGLLPAIEAQP